MLNSGPIGITQVDSPADAGDSLEHARGKEKRCTTACTMRQARRHNSSESCAEDGDCVCV